jgi:hypothetical protein
LRFFHIILLFFLLFQCKKNDNCSAKEPFRFSDTVSIGFYNVQNLFDLHYSGAEFVEYKPGISNWDRDMMQKKLENIASAIQAMDADVIGLCEIENGSALKKLQWDLQNKGCVFKHSAIAEDPVKSNTCTALISRFPIISSKGIAIPLEKGKTRNILEADVVIGTDTLKIFVNHWPSKMNPESWRVMCAKVLSSRIKEIPEGTDYILIGDFNTDYDEHFKITTTGIDNTIGGIGMHSLLRTIHKQSDSAMRYINEDDLKKSSERIHYDLWLELPESERMSYNYKGNRQTPDHILLPGALYDSRGISYVDNSFRSFNWDGMLLSGNRPFRWQVFRKKGVNLHTGKGYSDHLPIFALFVSGPFRYDSLESAQKNEFTRSFAGPSEILKRGWVLCNQETEMITDTTMRCTGKFSLCIRGEARTKNGCIAKLKLDISRISPQGFSFNIQGSGRICLRYRYNDKEWQYLDLNTLKESKSARYPLFLEKEWKKVIIRKMAEDNGSLDLEIRTGKGEPFCFWID